MGNNYQRQFYIFQNMDNNLGNPTGYIKVEINDLTAKLQISLGNLTDRPGMAYRLYGISRKENELRYAEICDIGNNNGRADYKFGLENSNIGGSNLCFDDINVFAVIAAIPDNNSVVCPLVAYRNGQVPWKQEFEAALRKPAPPVIVEAAVEKMNERIDMQRTIEEDAALPDIPAAGDRGNITEEISSFEEESRNIITEEGFEEESRNIITEEGFEEEGRNIVTEEGIEEEGRNIIAEEGFEEKGQNIITGEGLEREELEEETVGQLSDLIEVSVKNENEAEHSRTAAKPEPENVADKSRDDISSKFEATLTSIYNHEKVNDAISAESDIISAAEKNFRDISSINAEGDRVRKELDIDLLKEELDKSFEICNPFNTRSKRFKWWKINSPGYLNNILFRNNVKTYLLFNPKVMLAHYKYRYIVFGIRYDKYSGRERFVCGVPGVYSIDENPFGNLGSWAQLEGYRPKYGAFGYWIILIDPRTGKLIKIK